MKLIPLAVFLSLAATIPAMAQPQPQPQPRTDADTLNALAGEATDRVSALRQIGSALVQALQQAQQREQADAKKIALLTVQNAVAPTCPAGLTPYTTTDDKGEKLERGCMSTGIR